MFKLLNWSAGNAGTSKENNCPSDFFTNQLLRNFSCSEKYKKIPKKTSMVVYFELILAIKTPPRTAAFEISGKAVMMVFCATDVVARNC